MNEKEGQQKKPTRLLIGSVFIIGIMGGLFLSIFSVLIYLFNFSEVSPATYLLKPWLNRDWTDQWQGHILSIVVSGILSIIPSLIYYFLFKKINTMWLGVIYGFILWCIVTLALFPLFNVTEAITELTLETIVCTLAAYILYGTFVGYSISYDYYDMQVKAGEGELKELKTEL